MSGPNDEQRLVADLRRAADSYHPDTERIRRLMDERGAARRRRGPARRADRPGVPGRPLAWAAAAASVLLAVTGAELVVSGWAGRSGSASPAAQDDGPAVGLSDPLATSSATSWATSSTSASPTSSAGPSSTSASATSSTSSAGRSSASEPASAESSVPRHPSTPAQTRSSAAGSSGAGSSDTRSSEAPPSQAPSSTGVQPSGAVQPVPRTSSGAVLLMGDRDVSVTVTAIPVGAGRALGGSGSSWTAAPTAGGASPASGVGGVGTVGPVQVLGNASAVVPGPYRVTWSDGGGAGSSSTWMTAPRADARGVAGGLRLPVRFNPGPFTVTLLTGVVGGPGRIDVRLGGGSLVVDLPGCPGNGACGQEVRLVARPVNGGGGGGDVMFDLTSADAAGSVGFAGVTLS